MFLSKERIRSLLFSGCRLIMCYIFVFVHFLYIILAVILVWIVLHLSFNFHGWLCNMGLAHCWGLYGESVTLESKKVQKGQIKYEVEQHWGPKFLKVLPNSGKLMLNYELLCTKGNGDISFWVTFFFWPSLRCAFKLCLFQKTKKKTIRNVFYNLNN